MKKETIIRTAVLALALLNQCFTVAGKPIININENEVNELISVAFTVITAVVAWWKNNSFTPEAIEADRYLSKLRDGEPK